VSAPEPRRAPRDTAGVRCGRWATDIVEVAAFRGRAAEAAARALRRGWRLPESGHRVTVSRKLAICVRPDRWLLLSPSQLPGESAATWETEFGGVAAVVDLSSGLTALRLTGPAVRSALTRGCRLDLDPAVFADGHAAATIVAQVSVIVVALSSGMLLLTPSTTARHICEWLAQVAAPFGFEVLSAEQAS
jgi:heterotetrameric sarcosine oxidase gamma subunit